MDRVSDVVRKVFPNSKLLDISNLYGGRVNPIYNLKITNPKMELVMKTTNRPGIEMDSRFRKEEYVINLIRNNTDVPVSKVYTWDNSKEILPFEYMILSKLDGSNLRSIYRNLEVDEKLKLCEKAGEYLAKIHSIKLESFGSVMGSPVKTLKDDYYKFLRDNFRKTLSGIPEIDRIKEDVMDFVESNEYLLDVDVEPCLAHNDYHFGNIMASEQGITGIIDFEASKAGHNEQDLIIPKWWIFQEYDESELPFFEGYEKYGSVSIDFDKRIRLYELRTAVDILMATVKLHIGNVDERVKEYSSKIEKIIK
ncbi:MAG: aminoglycoside phosphotransferase family protein [Candidatus Aenigmatarchaeota archaeon]